MSDEIIYLELEPEVLSALESIANITGRSLEEIVREAVDQFVQNEKLELEQENQK